MFRFGVSIHSSCGVIKIKMRTAIGIALLTPLVVLALLLLLRRRKATKLAPDERQRTQDRDEQLPRPVLPAVSLAPPFTLIIEREQLRTKGYGPKFRRMRRPRSLAERPALVATTMRLGQP